MPERSKKQWQSNVKRKDKSTEFLHSLEVHVVAEDNPKRLEKIYFVIIYDK